MPKQPLKSYICPDCGEKQTEVIQWQTTSVAHEFSLKKEKWTAYNVDEAGGEHEDFVCPSCGGAFSQELIEELDLWNRI